MTHRKIINRSLPAVVLVFITATFFAGCAGLGTKPTPEEYEAKSMSDWRGSDRDRTG